MLMLPLMLPCSTITLHQPLRCLLRSALALEAALVLLTASLPVLESCCALNANVHPMYLVSGEGGGGGAAESGGRGGRAGGGAGHRCECQCAVVCNITNAPLAMALAAEAVVLVATLVVFVEVSDGSQGREL